MKILVYNPLFLVFFRSSDVDEVVLGTLIEVVQSLLCRGDLTMAKALRVVMLAKYEAKKLLMANNALPPSYQVSTRYVYSIL